MRPAVPWGPRTVWIGLAVFVSIFVVANIFVVAYVALADRRVTDAGDVLDRTTRVAEYASQRLQAATAGRAFPAAPKLLADQDALRITLGITVLTQVALFTVVGIASKQSFRELAHSVGLDRFRPWGLWRPALAVIAAYLMVVGYSIAADAIGIELLKPQSTVPIEVTRESLTLAMAAAVTLVGAPFTEELFFRGFVFSGLRRWGAAQAAIVSSITFAVFHFDPGSFIPFTIVALVLAWLYWSRGSLWDSLVFHCLFNATSFVFLVWG